MEVPLAIAAAAFGAYHLTTAKGVAPTLDPSPEQEFQDMLSNPEAMLMQDAQVNGTMAPWYGSASGRLPWGTGLSAPYFVNRPGESNMDSPVTDTYIQLLNAAYLNRIDLQQSMMANRPQFARKSAQPVYNGFTPEMTLKGPNGERYTTQHMLWSWLPKDPTDSDFNDAAALAKAVPPDPLLFTPDANFATAPGLDFRYSNY